MIEIGRLCVKTAGRDARMKCVVLDIIDGNFVLIDGQTRRKKCNITHLEPLNKVIPIDKNASHEEVVKAFKELDLEIREKKKKEATEKPAKKAKKK